MKSVNHERMKCGSLYNKYSNEMIIFGGKGKNLSDLPSDLRLLNQKKKKEMGPGHIMEIYDFHKNIWFDIPWRTKDKYSYYPCIWTIGSKCIFVASLVQPSFRNSNLKLKCEWIDLRECDQNRRNSLQFRQHFINGKNGNIGEFDRGQQTYFSLFANRN